MLVTSSNMCAIVDIRQEAFILDTCHRNLVQEWDRQMLPLKVELKLHKFEDEISFTIHFTCQPG